ncbi:peptidylprolyl isomerase [Candidatus Pelagibacter sp.]|nr:peptidylprolyl isomerase [Candidatus Pelagibacter sp.]|tara:strand:+ start:1885 stop:2826 length:942 start_codon:yes stop_codon:yes gene_type:complete
MNKIKFLFYIILLILFNQNTFSFENTIIYKVDNEIITSYDIKKEVKYLISLNTNLKSLKKNEILKLAHQSIIKEKIKLIELKKYYSLEDESNDKLTSQVTSDLYKSLGFKSEKDFISYLSIQNIQIDWVKNKLKIESLWNNLIYRKHKNQIVVDEDKIKKQVLKEIKSIKKQKKIFLSEILIKLTTESDQLKLIEEVERKIQEIGFDNAANTYSISNTANKGGKIGWVNESSLSSIIVKEIKNLKKGENTTPIKLASGFLILKVNDIEMSEVKVDQNKIVDSRINNELNKQLDQFSTLYYNKVKSKIKINEQK